MAKKVAAFTLGMVLVATSGFAKQVDQGAVEIFAGSNGGFSSTSSNGDKVTQLNLSVGGLYYVVPNLGVGAGADFTKYGGDADGSSYSFGPDLLYLYPLSEHVSPYVEVAGGYVSEDAGGDAPTLDGWFAGAAVGLTFFLNDSSSVNAGVYYDHTGGDLEADTVGLSLRLSIYLGMRGAH